MSSTNPTTPSCLTAIPLRGKAAAGLWHQQRNQPVMVDPQGWSQTPPHSPTLPHIPSPTAALLPISSRIPHDTPEGPPAPPRGTTQTCHPGRLPLPSRSQNSGLGSCHPPRQGHGDRPEPPQQSHTGASTPSGWGPVPSQPQGHSPQPGPCCGTRGQGPGPRRGAHACGDTKPGDLSKPWTREENQTPSRASGVPGARHQGSKGRQDSFSNPLRMKVENVIKMSPKYLKPHTSEKSRAPRARGKAGPPRSWRQRCFCNFPQQKAQGSSLAKESRTHSSAPSGDMLREAALLRPGTGGATQTPQVTGERSENQKLARKTTQKQYYL